MNAANIAISLLVLFTVIGHGALGAAPAPAPSIGGDTAATVLADIEESMISSLIFNTTLKLINAADLFPTIFSLPVATLLAPIDSAYKSIPKEVGALLKGPDAAEVTKNLLKYHIITQYKSSAEFQATTYLSALPTLLGPPIFIIPVGGQNFFAPNKTDLNVNATDFLPDLYANTVYSVQGIDQVLIPANLSKLLPVKSAAPAPAPVSSASAPTPGAVPTTSTPSPPASTSSPSTSSSSSPPPSSSSSGSPAPAPSASWVLSADMKFSALFGMVAMLLACI